jgi:hypothetical protein
MINLKTYAKISLTLLLFIIGASPSIFAKITMNSEVNVKILYDYSGSMYPGYPAKSHRPGVKYFHEYGRFRDWLTNFVTNQKRLNGTRISMSVFKSITTFTQKDIVEVHPLVPIDNFSVELAFKYIRKRGKDYTYLADSLDHFTPSNFEGLVWLITDNIVETSQGGSTTKDFFQSLRDKGKYRSVHIFGYPFRDPGTGQTSTLAVYGLLVSPYPIDNRTATWYDRKFIDFANVFPGNGHLKLKDLSVNVLEIIIKPIEIDIRSHKKIISDEGDYLKLPFEVSIKNNMSLHTITGGSLNIVLSKFFAPDPDNRNKYGLKNISTRTFKTSPIQIEGDIPPGRIQKVATFSIESTEKISVDISGFQDHISLALKPGHITYNGYVTAYSHHQLPVVLKNEGIENIKGIYGSKDIELIFSPEKKIIGIPFKSTQFPVRFFIQTSSSRGYILLFLLIALLVGGILLARYLIKPATFIIAIAGNKMEVPLRRLIGRHDIKYENELLGHVKRGMGEYLIYYPKDRVARYSFKPSSEKGKFEITIDERETIILFIEKLKSYKGQDFRRASAPRHFSHGVGKASQSQKAASRRSKIRKP